MVKFYFMEIGYAMVLNPRESEIYMTQFPVLGLQRWMSGMNEARDLQRGGRMFIKIHH